MTVLVILGVAAIGIVVVGYKLLRTTSENLPPKPQNWGRDPDDAEWEKEAKEYAHTVLGDLRSANEKWASSVGAFLAIVGLVAFAKDPGTLTSLDTAVAYAVISLLIASVALLSTSLVLAAMGAQGIPRHVRWLDGWSLKQATRLASSRAVTRLAWSRFFGLAGLILLVATTTIAWAESVSEEDAELSAVVILEDGLVTCGPMTMSADGLRVGDNVVTGIIELETVPNCPPSDGD